MNKLIIIGNLTADPALRYTPQSVAVCDFTVAVNNRRDAQEPAQYFRVTAWRQLAENCAKYLAKGRKVFVSGPVSFHTWETADGSHRVSLDVTADDVEFLSSAQAAGQNAQPAQRARGNAAPMQTMMGERYDDETEFSIVESEDLPF